MAMLCLLCVMLLGSSRSASAQQEPPDPVADAPIHLGILGVTPRVAITNLGVDTNVFNSTVDPKKDFTFTASPGVKLWMRTGRGVLSIDGRVDFVYFATYASERSANRATSTRYEYPFMRVKPFVSFSTLNTDERPGYEIDARVRRFEGDLLLGAVVPIGSVTQLEVARRQFRVSFADDATFEGQSLTQTLDRRLDAWEARYRQAFTVLTTLRVESSIERERFKYEPYRNSNSFKFSGGFDLDLQALVRGSAMVGYRRLVGAEGGTLAEFSGLIANVDAAYTAPTQTRVQTVVNRDLHYSFEIEQPYYVQTGWTLTGTQRVFGQWDVQFTGGRDWLDYRGLDPTDVRRDLIGRIGGGFGYDLGESVRLGFNMLWQRRQSPRVAHDYRQFTSGVSLTYGY